jgi:hypothetical protein
MYYKPHQPKYPPKGYVDAYQAGFNDGMNDDDPRFVISSDRAEYMAGYWAGQSRRVYLNSNRTNYCNNDQL